MNRQKLNENKTESGNTKKSGIATYRVYKSFEQA